MELPQNLLDLLDTLVERKFGGWRMHLGGELSARLSKEDVLQLLTHTYEAGHLDGYIDGSEAVDKAWYDANNPSPVVPCDNSYCVCPNHGWLPAVEKRESRSVQRRKAAQKGLPPPVFHPGTKVPTTEDEWLLNSMRYSSEEVDSWSDEKKEAMRVLPTPPEQLIKLNDHPEQQGLPSSATVVERGGVEYWEYPTTLETIRDSAERSAERVASWPKWKRDLAYAKDEEDE